MAEIQMIAEDNSVTMFRNEVISDIVSAQYAKSDTSGCFFSTNCKELLINVIEFLISWKIFR